MGEIWEFWDKLGAGFESVIQRIFHNCQGGHKQQVTKLGSDGSE